MSTYRAITRLAAVSALNNYLREPWPTIAGPNIFDSKIEPVEEMKLDNPFPCCVVYTDYDKDPWSKGVKAHQKRMTTVTLEIMIVQAEQVKDEDGADVYQLACPQNDSEIEFALDIFETQILRALSKGTVASDAFNYICPSYSSMVSRRGATVEGGKRLAARQITMEMDTIRDNPAGNIVPQVDAFLKELEKHSDYKDRALELRDIIQAGAEQTDAERHMRILGYGRDLVSRLGSEPGAQVLLPPNLTYHFTGVSP